MRKLLPLTLVLLAACGTPQERCIQRETRDLRTVDRLIAETEANLKRGYALEQVTIYTPVWTRCSDRSMIRLPDGTLRPDPSLCLEEEPQTVTRPKAINLSEEKQKLAGLKAKRAELSRAADAAIRQCKATYPE